MRKEIDPDRLPLGRRSGVFGAYSTGLIGSAGAFMLPQNFVSSTLLLEIAAPGILMFGPQASIVTSDSRPSTVYLPGLISCLLITLSANMARAAACAKSGC